MLKKLLALLLALLLASPALAGAESAILGAIKTVLDAEEFAYDVDEEYDDCYFAFDLTKPSVLGAEAYVDMYAYESGVSIIACYSELPPEASRDELIRLCNAFNASIYLGKFYVSPYQHDLCYELYLPLPGEEMGEGERTQIADALWTALGTMDYYQEYFLLVIENGEKAEHVLAMWEADEY